MLRFYSVPENNRRETKLLIPVADKALGVQAVAVAIWCPHTGRVCLLDFSCFVLHPTSVVGCDHYGVWSILALLVPPEEPQRHHVECAVSAGEAFM